MVLVNILVVFCLVVLNGLLAMSEMAVVSSRRGRLRQKADDGARGARVALGLVDDPNRFLSTVQIGITLVGVLAGAFSGTTLAEPLGNWLSQFGLFGASSPTVAFALVVIVTTYFTLIIGELVPKRVALRNPERVAALIAPPMGMMSRIGAPLVWLLKVSTESVLKLIGMQDKDEDSGVTEDEVRSMISEGTHEGVFDPREQSMIDGVLRLDDRSTRSVMVPRPNVVWLDINDDLAAVRAKIESTGFSRFLVCRGEIDELAGIVRTRDILDLLMRDEPFDLAKCMVEPMVVLETTPIIGLLDLFKNGRMHLAVVVDEYGSLEGIASMTDVVEVIAGDLPEHWEEVNEEAVQREDGSWLVDGMMDVEDFERALGLSGVSDGKGYHTVAGFVLHCAEQVPGVGEHINWNDIRFEVLDMDGHRIDKLLVTLPPKPSSADSESDSNNGGSGGNSDREEART